MVLLLSCFKRLFLIFNLALFNVNIASCHDEISVVMAMICRNEEVNFRSNLALWLPLVKYFVFVMDERTNDKSEEAIRSILNRKAEFVIVPNKFDGFGPARTLSLTEAWKNFPQASHVLIGDPDWRPDVSTMSLTHLDMTADVFRFTAYDRNGKTKRQMDWFLRHRKGLQMRYNLHEVLDIGYYNWKPIPWVVHEIEQPGTWHSAVGHGNSFGLKRYYFDLEMLEKDLVQYGHDPHTHYYLGVTHLAVVEKGSAVAPAKLQHHIDEAFKYLEMRTIAMYKEEFVSGESQLIT